MAAPLKEEIQMLKQNVQNKFEHIRKVLEVRERLLLRQIDVISTSAQQMTLGSPVTKSVCEKDADAPQELRFLTDSEDQLLAAIRSYGKFNLDSLNLAIQDLYMRNEDYIAPTNDHETMYKCLQADQLGANVSEATVADEQLADSIVVDFSRMAEAKALIHKAKTNTNVSSVPSLHLEELDDEQVTSITEVGPCVDKHRTANSRPEQGCADVGKKTKKQRFKPNITINSCNGTINLGNVENLTINCSNDEPEPSWSSSSTGTNTPGTTTNSDTGGSNSNNCSSTSSRSQSQKQKHANSAMRKQQSADKQPTAVHVDADDSDNANAVHCEFYNRLLNEIKNQLKQKSSNAQHCVADGSSSDSKLNANINSSSNGQTSPPGKRLILKNFENLRIILESNGPIANGCAEESFHPVQIEQWLAEIVSATDLEPMQNTDILEHSRLHSKSMSTKNC